MTVPKKYTVVQHSGYGYGGDPTFQRGLESRTVATKKEQDLVVKEGGRLFDSYGQAEDFADEEMYRNNETMVPSAPGAFSSKEIDSLLIYVPAVVPEPVNEVDPVVSHRP